MSYQQREKRNYNNSNNNSRYNYKNNPNHKNSYKNNNSNNKNNNSNNKNNKNPEFHRSFKHYQNLNNSIPDFILDKLKWMPNNKGYIWKGIYCFGEQPADSLEKNCMFEKKRDLLIIHEWNETEYKIWHKYGRCKKELFNSWKRKPKILDMMKKN